MRGRRIAFNRTAFRHFSAEVASSRDATDGTKKVKDCFPDSIQRVFYYATRIGLTPGRHPRQTGRMHVWRCASVHEANSVFSTLGMAGEIKTHSKQPPVLDFECDYFEARPHDLDAWVRDAREMPYMCYYQKSLRFWRISRATRFRYPQVDFWSSSWSSSARRSSAVAGAARAMRWRYSAGIDSL